MRPHRILSGVVVGAALALGAVSAPVAQAEPAAQADVTCGNAYWPHQRKDGTIGRVLTSPSAPVRTGPYSACTQVGEISQGAEVEYDCYVRNDYDNTWTWVRVPGGGSLGWVYDAHLSGNGSGEPCDR